MPDLRTVTSELPDPPYPESTKANGYKLELDLDRLYVSDAWILATPDERPWLLLMLAEAWRSVPIATFPSDRDLIAARLGTSREFLDAHAKVLLRDWRAHADERLYHEYLTGLVLGMTSRRTADRLRKQKKRERPIEKQGFRADSVGIQRNPAESDRSPTESAAEQETGSRKIEPPHNPPLPKNSSQTASAKAPSPPNPPVGGELSVKTTNPDWVPEGVDPQAWQDFVQHRKDIRKPLTPMAMTKAANVLRPLSPSEQRQSVDASIVSRWTGVFPPKAQGGSERLTREEEVAEHNRRFIERAFATGGKIL